MPVRLPSRIGSGLAVAGVLGFVPCSASAGPPAKPAADSAPATTTAPASNQRAQRFRDEGPLPSRRFMIGIEGVVMQAPPLRTEVVHLDPRFIGRSVALGGVGLFGRYRLRSIVGFDLGVRSGSIRYADRDKEDVISQDQVAAEGGVMLYLARGEVAQFALSGGLGGMFNRVGYEIEDGNDGVQTFGSGLVRVGAEAEFLVKRVAFVLSFRSYGVFTMRDQVRNRGALFAQATREARRAPVATLQTYLIGSAGIAYRF